MYGAVCTRVRCNPAGFIAPFAGLIEKNDRIYDARFVRETYEKISLEIAKVSCTNKGVAIIAKSHITVTNRV